MENTNAPPTEQRKAGRIKCDACYRALEPGEPWYEMRKSGAILCAKDVRLTTTDTVAHKGEV